MPRPFGLVLAGGQATRLGGTIKPLLDVGGRTILARIIDRLASQCDGVAISARGGPAPFGDFADVLPDATPDGRGPLAGVLAGLSYLERSGRTDQLLLTVPGDTPFLPCDLAERLVAARSAAGTILSVAHSAGRGHHVIALWPTSIRPLLEAALRDADRRGVAALQSSLTQACASWSADPVDPFFNINTPDDLAAANRLAHVYGW